MTMKDRETDLPQDGRRWEAVTGCGPFADLTVAMYATTDALDPGEHARFGFRVKPHHTNNRPVCHGGMLATFLDMALALGVRTFEASGGRDMPPSLPTISLTLDYLAPAHLGDWIDARVTVTRAGGTCFVQAMLHGLHGPVLRGSGVFKRTKPAA